MPSISPTPTTTDTTGPTASPTPTVTVTTTATPTATPTVTVTTTTTATPQPAPTATVTTTATAPPAPVDTSSADTTGAIIGIVALALIAAGAAAVFGCLWNAARTRVTRTENSLLKSTTHYLNDTGTLRANTPAASRPGTDITARVVALNHTASALAGSWNSLAGTATGSRAKQTQYGLIAAAITTQRDALHTWHATLTEGDGATTATAAANVSNADNALITLLADNYPLRIRTTTPTMNGK